MRRLLPTIEGVIDRRALVNVRIDRDRVRDVLVFDDASLMRNVDHRWHVRDPFYDR